MQVLGIYETSLNKRKVLKAAAAAAVVAYAQGTLTHADVC
jgi:hypothetical protein